MMIKDGQHNQPEAPENLVPPSQRSLCEVKEDITWKMVEEALTLVDIELGGEEEDTINAQIEKVKAFSYGDYPVNASRLAYIFEGLMFRE